MLKKKKVKEQAAVDSLPSSQVIEGVLNEEYYRRAYGSSVRSTVFVLFTILAVALLVATLILPVIRIYGNAMDPSLSGDNIIVCRKTGLPERNDVLVFYYNNKILIRRVIGMPGDVIELDQDGQVTVNGKQLTEDYVSELNLGESDLAYPYTVGEGDYFVLADNRTGVPDSRNSVFGCIQEENIIGTAMARVWPVSDLGFIR